MPSMESTEEREAYKHFKETLFNDLTENVKPVIMSLTMLAEDYHSMGAVVARSIEEYVRQVKSEQKLLGLYLMDSIIKNLRNTTDYIQIFEKNVVYLFLKVFENVDESNRKSMYKLRQTWNGIFSQEKLYDIDTRTKRIDPAWPVTALPSQSSNGASSTPVAAPPPAALSTQRNIEPLSRRPVVSEDQRQRENILVSIPVIKSTSIDEVKKFAQQKAESLKPTGIEHNNNNQRDVESKNEPIQQKSLTDLTVKTNKQSKNANTTGSPVRDPRLSRKLKSEQVIDSKSDTSLTNKNNSSSESKSPTSISPSAKKQLLSKSNAQKLTNNNKQITLLNGTKRPSPTASSQNQSDTKKARLSDTPTKLSKSIEKSQEKSLNESPLKQNKQLLNKIPKLNNKDSTNVRTLNTSPTNSNSSDKAEAIDNNASESKPQTKSKTDTNAARRTIILLPPPDSIENKKLEPANSNIKSNKEDIENNNKLEQTDTTLSSIYSNSSNASITETNSANANNPTSAAATVDINTNNNGVPAKKAKKTLIKELPNIPKITQLETVENKLTESLNKNKDDQPMDVSENVDDTNRICLNKKDTQKKKPLLENRPNVIEERAYGDVDIRFGDVDERCITTSTQSKPLNLQVLLEDIKKQLLSISSLNANITHDQTLHIINNNRKNLVSNTSILNQLETQLNEQNSKQTLTNKELDQNKEIVNILKNLIEQQQHLLNQTVGPKQSDAVSNGEYAGPDDLPPIRPKDRSENQEDSLLILDGRSFRIQPDQKSIIKYFYTNHEVFCDTRTKDIYIDTKRVGKMGDQTKEINLNGRKVRLMYMGKRVELWIDGISFHFRADSPPKQVSIQSKLSPVLKRYYVTIDSRNMNLMFNNFKVCAIGDGTALNCALGPDEFETHEISFVCPPKRIMIDGIERKMRYDLAIPCIEMDNGNFNVIRFTGAPREIHIDDMTFEVPLNEVKRIKLSGRAHELAWGGPGYEVIIDGRHYELQFNQPPREIVIGTRPHYVYIAGDAPDVKILGKIPPEFITQNIENITKSEPFMSQDVASTSQVAQTSGANNPPDVQELLKKLIAHKILPSSSSQIEAKEQSSNSELEYEKALQKEKERFNVPDLTSFDSDLLKQKYDGAIKSLYSGIQCAQCGNRFNQQQQQQDQSASVGQSRYSKHLDWHFRQNKKEKEEINKAHSRQWYYSLAEWVYYEEISEEVQLEQELQSDKQKTSQKETEKANEYGVADKDLDHSINQDNSALNFDNISCLNVSSVNRHVSSLYNGVKTCPASDDIGDSCNICNDPFEIFWFAEREEWHFKDAIRVDNKIYHPICFEDAREEIQNSSSLMNQSNIQTTEENSTHLIKSEPI